MSGVNRITYWSQGVAYLPHKCQPPLPSNRQHPSYGDCPEVKREYYQNCSVLGHVTQCSQSAAHLYEQFLQDLYCVWWDVKPCSINQCFHCHFKPHFFMHCLLWLRSSDIVPDTAIIPVIIIRIFMPSEHEYQNENVTFNYAITANISR